LLLVQTAAGIHLAGDRRASADELWWRETTPADVGRLLSSLNDLSNRETGMPGSLAVTVQAPRESALGWALRDYSAVAFEEDPTGTAPAACLAPKTERNGEVAAPALAAAYRGEAFTVAETRAWGGFPPEVFGWLITREGSVTREQYVLWVRADLFPGR
jgi:hypothetical protein